MVEYSSSMADTTTQSKSISSFSPKEIKKPSASQNVMPIGGRVGFFEDGEEEKQQNPGPPQASSPTTTVSDAFYEAFKHVPFNLLDPAVKLFDPAVTEVKEGLGALGELVKDVSGIGQEVQQAGKKFSSKGEIDVKAENKKAAENYAKMNWKAALENLAKQIQSEQQKRSWKEALRLEVAGVSAEETNKKLGLNASYSKEHTDNPYHMAAQRTKVVEENEAAERARKQQSIAAATGAGKFDLNKIAEGGSILSTTGGAGAG